MSELITIQVNGRPFRVARGSLLASALALTGEVRFRRSVTGQPRGPLCGMGICFECRVTLNHQPHVRSCQVCCEEGLEVRTDE